MVGSGCFLLLFVLACNKQAYSASRKRFNVLYEEGLAAYGAQQWTRSSELFQDAVDQYNKEKDKLFSCVRKCRDEKTTDDSLFTPNGKLAETELQVVHVSYCVQKCRETTFAREGVPLEIVDTFETRLPYDFLQFSLTKAGKTKEGCRRFMTYRYFHPDGHKVEDNYKHYLSLKLHESAYVPVETMPYRDLFTEGMELYTDANWIEAVTKFEASLEDLYAKLDECYIMCEAFNVDDLGVSEYHGLLSGLFMASLKCRTECLNRLDFFRIDPEPDLLASHYEYLQYTYFKLGRKSEALTTFAALARLTPNTSMVNGSWNFYKSIAPVSNWTLRENDARVVEQILDDRALLQLFTEVSGKDTLKPKQDDDATLLEQDFADHPVGQADPKVVKTDDELLGVNRVVFDDVITSYQCKLLIDLAQLAREGDGYGKKSPHTEHEKFEGLTAIGAAEAVLTDDATVEAANLYLTAANTSRALVEEHFKLNTTLYFSFTHLVCRTAIPDGQEFRADLSHPVHADNCILDPATGKCDKIQPAYTWRDYSAILYLNDGFDGGDFFFAHSTSDLTPQTYVSPKCGRLVGFSAGKENMHGVTAVTNGRRCAVALWFTLDPVYKEQHYDDALKMLLNHKKS